MSIVARMQLAMAVIKQFGFESVIRVTVDDGRPEILLLDSNEFYKVGQDYKSLPTSSSHFSARMEAEIDGVLLITFKPAEEMSVAS